VVRVQFVTEGHNPISWGIRRETSKWCSHVELVDLSCGVTLGARSRSTHYPGGVQIRDCNRDHYSKVEQFVLNHPESPRLLKLAWDWLYAKIGTPYNYLGIVGIATDSTIENPKAMDCSHSIHLATWKGSDFPLLSTRPSNLPWKITPADLLLSRQLVYIAGRASR